MGANEALMNLGPTERAQWKRFILSEIRRH